MKRKPKLVIDASCILSIIAQEPAAIDVKNKASGYELAAPDCLSFEIGNALAKLVKRKLFTGEAAVELFNAFKQIPITVKLSSVEDSLQLACEENHYIYAMFYLDCALKTGYPLLTLDEKLIQIAKKRGVECL